jgi:hypothetical protein
MHMWNKYRRATAALLGGLLMAGLGGCGGNSDDSEAQVRLVNASMGYTSMDLYVDDTLTSSAIGYGQTSGYHAFTSGSHTTSFTSNGSSTYLLTQTRSLAKDAPVTVITYGWQGSLKALALTDTETAAASGKAKLLVYNTSTDAGSVDVYLSGSADAIEDATAVAYTVAGGSAYSGGYVSVNAGTYRLRVTVAGSTTDVLLDTSGLTLSSTQVAALVITPTASGVLVNGLLVPQGGTVTALDNPQARARVVSAVSDSGVVSASLGGTPLTSGATAPAIGSYVRLSAGSLTPTVTVNGTAMTLSAQTVAAGGDYTLLVWGSAAAPQFSLINDDNRLPTTSTNAKLRVIHGLDSTATLTLTADYYPVADGVAQGTASSFATLTAATLSNLAVQSSAGTLYSDDDVTLSAKGVYTVFMLGSSSNPLHALRKER